MRLLVLAALANNWGGITEAAVSQVDHQVQRLSEAAIENYTSSITEQKGDLATP